MSLSTLTHTHSPLTTYSRVPPDMNLIIETYSVSYPLVSCFTISCLLECFLCVFPPPNVLFFNRNMHQCHLCPRTDYGTKLSLQDTLQRCICADWMPKMPHRHKLPLPYLGPHCCPALSWILFLLPFLWVMPRVDTTMSTKATSLDSTYRRNWER